MNLGAFRDRVANADVVFIHDEAGSVYDWKLRSLPALQCLCLSDFTYPTSWRQLKRSSEYDRGGRQYSFPGYDYHVLGGIDLPHDRDLGAITTTYYENNTQYSIRSLIDRYVGKEGTLAIVADDSHFQPDGGARPLYQEQFVTDLKSYDRLYEAVEGAYGDAGWNFPLRDTKNRFLQDMANIYELVENDRLTTSEELFRVLKDAPYLPLYRVFGEIFDHPETHGSGPLENNDKVDALGGWLRRRIEWEKSTGRDIARQLNRDVTSDASTFDLSYLRRSPKVAEAASAAEQLDPESNSIDAQYHGWLTETQL